MSFFHPHKNKPTLTEPLAGRNNQVSIPFPVLDTLLADEPLLERDELRIRTLHTLRGLDELLHRVLLPERVPDEPLQEPLEGRRGRLGELAEQLPELLLCSDLLLVELVARLLELFEGVAQAVEVDGIDDL